MRRHADALPDADGAGPERGGGGRAAGVVAAAQDGPGAGPPGTDRAAGRRGAEQHRGRGGGGGRRAGGGVGAAQGGPGAGPPGTDRAAGGRGAEQHRDRGGAGRREAHRRQGARARRAGTAGRGGRGGPQGGPGGGGGGGGAKRTVGVWRARFARDGLDGLRDEPRSGAPRTVTDERVAELLVRTLEATPENATHCSTRSMAAACGLSPATVQRVWRAFGLRPHRVETSKFPSDPEFVEKVRDVVGLYLAPPDRALVLCVDEKTEMQAVEPTQPVLPRRPGRRGGGAADDARAGRRGG